MSAQGGDGGAGLQSVSLSGMPHPRGWWRRPARWPALIALVLSIVLAWAALCGVAAWRLWRDAVMVLPMQGQAVTLHLPEGLAAHAQVAAPVSTQVRLTQALALPLDQPVAVRLLDRVQGQARLHVDVPVSTEVRVEAEAPVNAELLMDVPVVSWLPSLRVTVPLAVRVPIRTTVPVAVTVPLTLDVKVDAALDHTLKVPLRDTLRTRVDVAQPWRAQVVNQTRYVLQGEGPKLPLQVEQGRLRVPLRDVRWAVTP